MSAAVPLVRPDVIARALQDVADAKAGPDEPGLVVGLCRDGELIGASAAGLSDLERQVPITAHTVFDIASCSKQVCATVLLLLERDGLLTLDDPLAKHLPDLRLRAPVTLRQSLQHTAGLREYLALSLLVGGGADSCTSEHDVIRLLNGQVDTDFAPSTDWSYSNTGYVAAAAIVRAVTGRSLAQVAAERIFAPLGMANTRFHDDASALVPHRATGHAKLTEGFGRAERYPSVVGDSGILTTLADAAKWLAFVADGRVLGTDIRESLLACTQLTDGRALPYSLGLEHETIHGLPAAGHGGATAGFRAHLSVLLDGGGLGVIVLTNRSDIQPHRVARDALGLALGASCVPSPPPPGPAAVSEELLGLWFDDRELAVLCIVRTATGVGFTSGATVADFEPAGPQRWNVPALGPLAHAILHDDGTTLHLIVHRWRPRRMRRISAVDAVSAPCGAYLSRELNAVLTICHDADGLTLQCGAARRERLEALSLPDHWRTSSWVLTVERDDAQQVERVLVSGPRMRRVAFEPIDRAAPAPALPLGFPVPLGGPTG